MSEEKKAKSGFLGRFKKERKVTALSVASVAAGSSAGSGELSGSRNSAATLQNLRNASADLDNYLREMDANDDRLEDVISMSRFIEKAESYLNSSLASCSMTEVLMLVAYLNHCFHIGKSSDLLNCKAILLLC
jgi:hypothetical protein